MFEKLTDAEMEQLDAMLTRAVYNNQFSVGVFLDGDDQQSFANAEDVAGVDGYNGEVTGVLLNYDGLKWLWARVQGARGGKKRTLTSEQAKAMAAKRHGKKDA